MTIFRVSSCINSPFVRSGFIAVKQPSAMLSSGTTICSNLFFSALRSLYLGAERSASKRYLSTPALTSTFWLNSALKSGRDHYLFLQKASNDQKIERTFQQALSNYLTFFVQEDSEVITQESWNHLRDVLKQHSVVLPPFDGQISNDNVQALFSLFPRKLMKETGLHTDFQRQSYITNQTELYWSSVLPTFPFTRVQEQLIFDPSRVSYILEQTSFHKVLLEPIEKEIQDWISFSSSEDALGALLLATPHLDQDTIVHEMGCWNGENLFNLLFHAHVNRKMVAGCVGTDINLPVLNIAQTAGNIIGLKEPLVQFHLANALHSVNLMSLGIQYKKELKIALRVLPVLAPENARDFLLAVRNSFKGEKPVLIVSYALLKGEMYERNKQKANSHRESSCKESPFAGGTVFKTSFPFPDSLPFYLESRERHDMVLNTYYTPDGFNRLVKESGFLVTQMITVGQNSDNYRNVAILVPS